MHWVHIKEASCLMLKGLISLSPPVKNRFARKALARSVGWKGSQNKWSDRFLHRLDVGVHANKPLKGPSPQHPMFVVPNPVHRHKPKIIWQSLGDWSIIIRVLENVEQNTPINSLSQTSLASNQSWNITWCFFPIPDLNTLYTLPYAHEYGKNLKWLGLQGHKVYQLKHVIVTLIQSKPWIFLHKLNKVCSWEP